MGIELVVIFSGVVSIIVSSQYFKLKRLELLKTKEAEPILQLKERISDLEHQLQHMEHRFKNLEVITLTQHSSLLSLEEEEHLKTQIKALKNTLNSSQNS